MRTARLPRSFFARRTVDVARALLGTTLWTRQGTMRRSVRLVETEAYVARDPASHAFRGRTRRNRSMFLRPGTLYVFRIHQVVCANVVTRPGEAVLFRAGAVSSAPPTAARGPGRLCRELGLTIADDGLDLVRSRRAGLAPAPAGRRPRIVAGPRVGLSRATERPLRFCWEGEPAVSSPRPPIVRTSGKGRSPRARQGVRRAGSLPVRDAANVRTPSSGGGRCAAT